MKNVCMTCLHYKQNLEFPIKQNGTCKHLLDYRGWGLSMKPEDFCSHHVPIKVCVKEPTDAASVLMSLLIKQVTELQSKVQDLSLKMDIMNARLDNHVDDRDRHLRQPGKYTAHNLFM